MFSGPQFGDDFDPSLVTRSELATSLINFATNTALGETQVTSIQALTQAQGNSTIIASLDQRVTAELANKLEATSLAPYALQTSVTQLALDQAATNQALQTAQLATSILQSSVNTSLSLKANQNDLDAVNLLLQNAVTSSVLDTAFIPYSTTTSVNQSIAISKGVIESTAAATYATQQQVTQLSVDVAGKTSQADLTLALQNYNTSA